MLMTVRHLLTSTLYNTQVHQHHLPLSARVEKSKQKCHFELIVLFFWPEGSALVQSHCCYSVAYDYSSQIFPSRVGGDKKRDQKSEYWTSHS